MPLRLNCMQSMYENIETAHLCSPLINHTQQWFVFCNCLYSCVYMFMCYSSCELLKHHFFHATWFRHYRAGKGVEKWCSYSSCNWSSVKGNSFGSQKLYSFCYGISGLLCYHDLFSLSSCIAYH